MAPLLTFALWFHADLYEIFTIAVFSKRFITTQKIPCNFVGSVSFKKNY